MTWRRPTLAELQSAPLPLVWWRDYDRFATRTAARKQYTLSLSLAQLGGAAYEQALDQEVTVEGHMGDGTPVVQWLALVGAVEKQQAAGFNAMLALIPDGELRGWVSQNSGGIGTLVRWQLAHTYATQMFSAFVMAAPPNPPGDERQRQLVMVRSPQHEAMAWANWAVARAYGYDEVSWIVGHVWAGALGITAARWPAPPYQF